MQPILYPQKQSFAKYFRANWALYLLSIPGLVYIVGYKVLPLVGLQLAFKDFDMFAGNGILDSMFKSEWTGLAYFENIFRSSNFTHLLANTLTISLMKLLINFPLPILLALMLNELRMRRYKKLLQTVYTFPHFLSWVIVGSIVKNLLSVDGVVNGLMAGMGLEKVSFLGNKDLFRPLIYISEIWKEAGWSSIIYLAAISGIDPQLYEVAEIDGASRFQRVVNITLPSIFPTIAVMLILQMGGIMGGHFDQIYNLQNDVIASSAETLNLYIYRITFQRTPNYGFSTAVSLFCSVINMVLLMSTNKVAERFGGTGLMGGVK